MAEPAVLLIHGLGGTQYDLGSLHKRFRSAGFAPHAVTLPGHGTRPEDLRGVRAEDWLDAVRARYRELVATHETVHVTGMCMGALLAIELCKRERHARGRLVALAPPVFLDGWSTPWYSSLRHLIYRVPMLSERMRVNEEEPYGVRNEQLRAIIRRKFARGDTFAYGWVPLACIREVDRLRRFVMRGLERIDCPTLVIHARQDELTSLRSATFLAARVGGGRRPGQTTTVVLEDSYHLICVDNDKETVAKNVIDFCLADADHEWPVPSGDAPLQSFASQVTPVQIPDSSVLKSTTPSRRRREQGRATAPAAPGHPRAHCGTA